MTLSINFSNLPENEALNLDLSHLEQFKKITAGTKTQFFHTFEQSHLINSTKEIYQKFKHKKIFVHVGIGGSSLGPEMLIQAIKHNETKFIFINNIDPDEIYDQLKNLNLSECLFYFVSKSGGTAETLAALSIITDKLTNEGINLDQLNQYFVFATDPLQSELLEISKPLKISCLEVPSNVGGRFCVLTPVGYLPALYAGINLDQLIKGATAAQVICLDQSNENLLLKTCDFLFNLKSKQNISQTVLMPYSSKLKYFSFWFAQLWAESLGKKVNLKQEIVHTGFTPIPAFGASDQHSQMQLFMEGPKDKVICLIQVLNFKNSFSLKSKIKSKSLDKLSSFTLADLMKAELHGTLKALAAANRPFIHIYIDQLDEYHLGLLIVFFESLTALMGHYLNIDPFNQPGVEAGKIYAFEFLSQLK